MNCASTYQGVDSSTLPLASTSSRSALSRAGDAAYVKVQAAEAASRSLPGEADAFERSDVVMHAFRDTPP